jgi:hypothetical protein
MFLNDALKHLNQTTGGAFALDGDQLKGRLPEDGDRHGELYPIWLEADDCRELAEALIVIAKHLETA